MCILILKRVFVGGRQQAGGTGADGGKVRELTWRKKIDAWPLQPVMCTMETEAGRAERVTDHIGIIQARLVWAPHFVTGPCSNGNVIGGISLESTECEGGIKPPPLCFVWAVFSPPPKRIGTMGKFLSTVPLGGSAQISFSTFSGYRRPSEAVVLAHLHCVDTCLCTAFEVGAMCSADKDVSSVVGTKLPGHILLTWARLTEVALPCGWISLLSHQQ